MAAGQVVPLTTEEVCLDLFLVRMWKHIAFLEEKCKTFDNNTIEIALNYLVEYHIGQIQRRHLQIKVFLLLVDI